MEMRRLSAFCKVVELSSFTKAAEALSLSQPTVSEHVRTLEDTVGERLVDRLGREVRPTPAGKLFYEYAKRIVRLRDDALQALNRFRGNLTGKLKLGASTIPGTYILPRLIGEFRSEHPGVQVSLTIGDSAEILQCTLEGEAEAGFVGTLSTDKRVISTEIFQDELVLAVYPEHRWAGRSSITANELIGEPFIQRERGSGTREAMSRMMEAQGCDPSRLDGIAEIGSTEAVKQGIKARIGISILSKEAVAEDFCYGSLRLIPIENLSLTRSIYLIQHKNRQSSPICGAFLERLEQRTGREGLTLSAPPEGDGSEQ